MWQQKTYNSCPDARTRTREMSDSTSVHILDFPLFWPNTSVTLVSYSHAQKHAYSRQKEDIPSWKSGTSSNRSGTFPKKSRIVSKKKWDILTNKCHIFREIWHIFREKWLISLENWLRLPDSNNKRPSDWLLVWDFIFGVVTVRDKKIVCYYIVETGQWLLNIVRLFSPRCKHYHEKGEGNARIIITPYPFIIVCFSIKFSITRYIDSLHIPIPMERITVKRTFFLSPVISTLFDKFFSGHIVVVLEGRIRRESIFLQKGSMS